MGWEQALQTRAHGIARAAAARALGGGRNGCGRAPDARRKRAEPFIHPMGVGETETGAGRPRTAYEQFQVQVAVIRTPCVSLFSQSYASKAAKKKRVFGKIEFRASWLRKKSQFPARERL
eukprot:gene22542-biopygen13284